VNDKDGILVARDLVVEYPGVRALDRVDFDLRRGEIHVVMGENGAGKSTLINVLSGAVRPERGTITLAGRSVRFVSPRAAESAGVSTVRQEVDLVATLSVAENICLGRPHPGPLPKGEGVVQPRRWRWIAGGLIDHRAMKQRAARALARLGVNIDVSRLLREFSIATQQMVAIARALDIDVRVLILDEPTSSLDAGETQALFQVMRRLREHGIGIIFITHFIEQAYAVADRITVLRNGRNLGTWPAADLSRAALIEAMTGRRIQTRPEIENHHRGAEDAEKTARPELLLPNPKAAIQYPKSLSVNRVGKRGMIASTSLNVAAGEAVGLAGLLGSGRSELARLIFGADRPDSGAVRIVDRALKPGSVRGAIAAGMGFTPEDRRDGLAMDLSVRENIVLALQARQGVWRSLSRRKQQQIAERLIRALNIRTPDVHAPVRNLSGGNQQKVLLARWLAMDSRVLVLDEPARSVDVGARAEIEALIDSLRRDGVAIVLISAELDEMTRMCDRVLVLRDRAPVGMLEGDAVSESAILRMIAGGEFTTENAEKTKKLERQE